MKYVINSRTRMFLYIATITAFVLINIGGLNIATANAQAYDNHPFLVVTEADYEELQEKALRSPWSDMKKEAIAYISDDNNNYSNHIEIEPTKRATLLSNIMSSASLAYILDPDNRAFYVKKISENLSYWDHLHADRHHYSNQWEYQVPGGDALYNSILALDLIHDELSDSDRERLEEKIDTAVEFIYTGWDSWGLNRFGVRGLWALYQGDPTHVSTQEYMDKLYEYITKDGVFAPGPTYSTRITGHANRDPKATFMDILHRHELYDIYGDARLQRGYEWIFGYAASPTGRYYTFGDSGPGKFNPTGLAGYRASKFSDKAGGLASNAIGDTSPPARFLHYVLMTDQQPEPVKPTSSLFQDGGAWFMEEDVSELSLAGAMWNATILGDYHQHKEVNAIQISAYGEDVIRNVGYNGWGNGADDYSWDYVNQTAVSGNTVLINDENHQYRTGGGLSEGFASKLFDYASGDSREAIAKGEHHRNFVFVHPQDEKPGYFVLFDEIKGNNSTNHVNVALHPNSNDYSVISDKLEYLWKVGPNYLDQDVFVTLFLGTEPDGVDIRDGILLRGQNTESGHLVGKYLYSTYEADSNGKNIVSVIFPYNQDHKKADMKRISMDNYTGVLLDHGDGIIDYALESNSSSILSLPEDIEFQGRATSFRKSLNRTSFYFVRKGTQFMNNNIGFTSDRPISIHMNEDEGSIVSEGANVTFKLSDIETVLIDNIKADVIASDANSVQVHIPEGEYKIDLIVK